MIKCYVHHNGRSKEYATFTDYKGNEILTVHYTEFDKITNYFKEKFQTQSDND